MVRHSNEYTQVLCAQLFSDVMAYSAAVCKVQLLEVSDLRHSGTQIVICQRKVVLEAEYFESGAADGGSQTSQLVSVQVQHLDAEPTDGDGQIGQHCAIHIDAARKVEALESLQADKEAPQAGSSHVQTVADGDAF